MCASARIAAAGSAVVSIRSSRSAPEDAVARRQHLDPPGARRGDHRRGGGVDHGGDAAGLGVKQGASCHEALRSGPGHARRKVAPHTARAARAGKRRPGIPPASIGSSRRGWSGFHTCGARFCGNVAHQAEPGGNHARPPALPRCPSPRGRYDGRTMTKRLLGVLVAAACSAAGTATTAANLKPIDPPALQAAVEAVGRELLLPGAMVLLRTPEGDFAYGYGATELGGATAPAGDTHFRIASNTKTMTAAVTVLLAQEGKLRLDDPVSKYVRAFPTGTTSRSATCSRCGAGCPSSPSAPELAESLDHDPSRVWTPEELLAIAFKNPPMFAPDAEFFYCNTNYVLLGLIVEQGRRRAAGPGLSGSAVRTARHEEHAAARRRVDRDPRALLAWLHVWGAVVRHDRCALSGRTPGGGAGGNARAQRLHPPESVLRQGCRRRDLHRRRSGDLDAGAGRRRGASTPTSSGSGSRASCRRTRPRPRARSTATA